MKAIAGITTEMVSAYQLWLCPAPEQRIYLGCPIVLRVCVAERIVVIDPARNVELPRVGRRLPRGVLSPAEMRAVLRAPDLTTYTGFRRREIFRVV